MENKINYFFIVGCARSGTSILGELIQSHPDIQYLFEASQIWETAGLGENESHRLTSERATEMIAQTIQTRFAGQTQEKSILVEKSPRNSLRIPFIRSIFPEAKFIHIIRDGRDVACSMIPGCGESEWNHLKPPSWKFFFENYTGAVRCAYAWKEILEITLGDLVEVPHLQVRYEDLVTAPYQTANKIFKFIGLNIHPQTLAFCENISNQTDGSYHAQRQSQWSRNDHKIRMGRWRENLTLGEQDAIQKLLQPLLSDLGYLKHSNFTSAQKQEKKRLVVVLGMHRSGTSAIARSLQVLNVNMGENLMPAVPGDNDKGFWEDLDINHLNEKMLLALSNSWEYLLPINSEDMEKLRRLGFLEQATQLLQEKISSSQIFGVKDPRLIKLLPFWEQVFSKLQLDVSYVLALRHPLSVAQSLFKRNGFPKEKGLLMWLDHTLTSVCATMGKPRILIHYDSLLEDPEKALNKLGKFLKLKLDIYELNVYRDEFLDKNLRRHIPTNDEIENIELASPIISDLYKTLVNFHLQPEKLKHIAFVRKVNIWQDELKRQNLAWELINYYTEENNNLKKQLKQRNAELAQRNAELAQRNAELTQRNAELAEIQKSRSWKFMLTLQKIRLVLIPLDSKREKIIKSIWNMLRNSRSN